jgi:pyrroline-5-carboxylate reductase
MKDKTIAFIGCGNMGRCLIGGLILDGYPSAKLRAADPDPEQLERLSQRFPVSTSTDNLEAVREANVVVFAVKPQVMKAVAREVAEDLQSHRSLVISIAAGIRTRALSHWLGAGVPIVRAMPNTPSLVGSGAAALYAMANVNKIQREIAEAILRAVGLTVWIEDETLMDAVTAVSGSGPAYFFLLMELIENAAVDLGLPRDTARLLTLQTAFGAAKMALESSLGAAHLRVQVTSPGGTTEQALKVFEEGGLDRIVNQALRSAKTRSEELAEALGNTQ